MKTSSAPKTLPPPPLPPPKIRLNQRDLDSSCYRLSRVPQKFAMSKAVKPETTDSFAATYYSQNPIDTRAPSEKLSDVEEKLASGPSDDDEKFALLVQKKSLSHMIYGENSPEAIHAGIELGAFYNEHNKPDSAARNLLKASQSAKVTEVQESDLFLLGIELADANLNATAPTKTDRKKQVDQADAALSPYRDYQSDNKLDCFRRDLYLGRIRSFGGEWSEALVFYERALAAYSEVHPDEKKAEGEDDESKEKSPEEANISVEAAQVAERIEGCDKAPGLYRKAYDLYIEQGFPEYAQGIEAKIGPPIENEKVEQGGESEVVK